MAMKTFLIFCILAFPLWAQTKKVETDTLKARAAFKLKESGVWKNRTSFFPRLDANNYVTSTGILDGTITFSDIANSTITVSKLAFSISGDGLYFDEFNTLHVQGDGSTIGVISDQVQILANAIDSSHVINHSIDTTDLKWNYFNLTPGNGLTGQERIRLGTSNIWDVNPDNTTITISGDAVAVKDAGIYPEKVNALVAGLGLGKPSAESGIQINAGDGLFIENDTLKVNASGVINAGLGLSQDGNDFNVNTKEGIVISADTVQLNPSIGGIGLSYDTGVLNVKAGHGVQISSDTVRINPAIAGKGLKWKGDSLDINITDKSLIISSDTLKVNSAIAGAGLGYAAELMAVNVNRGLSIAADSVGIDVDGETIEISGAGELQQKRDRVLNLLASWSVWDRPVERNYVELETDDAVLDTVYFAIPYVQIGDSVRIDSVHFYMAGDGASSLDIFKLMTNNNGSDAVAYTSTTEKNLTSGNVTIKYNSIAKSVAMPLTLFVRADLAASANIKFYNIRIYLWL